MVLRKRLTRKNAFIGSLILAPMLVVAAYLALRRPARAQMEHYVPATALAFIEIDSLADVLDGLTHTKAWRELAPALGLSSQLTQLAPVADLMGRTGLGPDEAVVAGRGQFAVAITGIEAESGASDEGPYVHFKPRFALIIETHTKPETASKLARERVPILAQRLYGDSAREEHRTYSGTAVSVFSGQTPERQLAVAATGTVVLIANHQAALESCLDTISGRMPSLADDETLKAFRPVVDRNASILAFVTAGGSEKLAQLGPALFASRFTTDPDRIGAIASLFGHLAKQAIRGLLYGAEFTPEGVTDRYLTLLAPQVAAEIAESLKPAGSANLESLRLVPRKVEDFTLLNIDHVGDVPERTLKRLAPRLDVVAGLALREFVINLRKQLGLEASDSIGEALGSEVTLMKFSDGEPVAMLIDVRDRSQTLTPVSRYLKHRAAWVSTQLYKGVEIAVSSNEDGRAAAFVENHLVLGTRAQIEKITDTQGAGSGMASDERVGAVLQRRPARAAVASYKPAARDAGEMMLVISELARATDGSLEVLELDSVREALSRLPASFSFTEFRDYGVYTETTSAVGNFGLIASLLSDNKGE